MAINIRRATEAIIQPKQIKEEHLDDGAVVERVLAPGAVATGKIKDAAITLSKAADDIRMHQFAGEETEVAVLTDTWSVAKEARFLKHPRNPLATMRFFGSLRSAVDGISGYIGVFVDSEPTPRFEEQTSSVTYDIVFGEFDISDLSVGRHIMSVSLRSAVAGTTVFNDHIDILFIK